MINKYLEKIAFLGFSKEEKRNKLARKAYIEFHNTIADHGNSILKNLQKTHGHLPGPEYNNKYLNTLAKDKNLKAALKASHEKYEPKLKEYGGTLGGSSDDSLKNYVSEMREVFKGFDKK